MELHPLAAQFASIADAYERGRPEYAPAVVGAIVAELGLAPDARVLDLAAGTGKLTLWVSPEMLDLQQRVTVMVNGRRVNTADRTIEPSLEVLLEDARTRADRQHPFWARVDAPTGRVVKGN